MNTYICGVIQEADSITHAKERIETAEIQLDYSNLECHDKELLYSAGTVFIGIVTAALVGAIVGVILR